MKRRELLLGTLGLSLSAHAQESPPLPTPRNLTPEQQRQLEQYQRLNRSLEQSITSLPESQLPRNGLWLIVNSGAVPASVARFNRGDSPNTTPQALLSSLDTSTLEGVTRAFGRRRVRFGRLVALVPETMTVLHTNPKLGESVPLGELISTDPLTALLATLSDPQFDQLVSRGLGFRDLSPDQASLLKKALPKPFKVAPANVSPGTIEFQEFQAATTPEQRKALQERSKAAQEAYEKQTKTLSERELLSGLRLRVFQSRHYTFGVPGQQGFGVAITPASEKPQEGWKLEGDGMEFAVPNETSPLTAYLKSELPNQLKPSELPLSAPALRRSIRLDSPKTVGELVVQLGQATGLELYCAPRLAVQKLTLLGETDLSVPVQELTQALALSVCGTWRRVGTGYVLTYDRTGFATLHAQQARIVKRWEARAKAASKSNTKRLKKRSWTTTLPFVPGDPSALPQEFLGKSKLPFSELPAPLRQAIRADLERSATPREPLPGLPPDPNEQNQHLPYSKVLSGLKDDSSVGLDTNLQFGVELEGLGVMRLGQWRWLDDDGEPPATVEAPVPPVQPIPIPEAFRGILAATDRVSEAVALVQKTKAMGFNALLLAATPQGAPYFTSGDPTKVLVAAIVEGKKQGVAVWAAVDVLCWRRDRLQPKPAPLPPGVTEDLGLFGETNSAGVLSSLATRTEEPAWFHDYMKRRMGNDGFVSPFVPEVKSHLKTLVAALARTPGLAGIAFQRSAPPGYQDLDYYPGVDFLELGYLLEPRLQRLRAGLEDPLDESNSRGQEGLYFSVGNRYENLKLTVPEFTAVATGTSTWQKARTKAATELLTELFQSARHTAPDLPLLMRERKFDLTFEPWTEAGRLHEMQSTDASADAMGQKASEKTVLVASVSPGALRDWRKLRGEIESERRQNGRGKSKSLILDLLTENPSVDCPTALETIAPYVKTAI